jgi:hypothetical protein
MGIATSSFTNAEILYFHVHLSTGVSLTINSGFIQIIQEPQSEIHTSEEEREDNLIDTQYEEQYGRPSSCEDLDLSSSEEDEFWPEELLHAPAAEALHATTVPMGGGGTRSAEEDASINREEEKGDVDEAQHLAEAAVALLQYDNDSVQRRSELHVEGHIRPDSSRDGNLLCREPAQESFPPNGGAHLWGTGRLRGHPRGRGGGGPEPRQRRKLPRPRQRPTAAVPVAAPAAALVAAQARRGQYMLQTLISYASPLHCPG